MSPIFPEGVQPSCTDPGIFVSGGPGQSDEKAGFFVCFFVISLFYRSQMVNFKEIYHFSRFQGGPTISVGGGGAPTISKGGGGLQLLIPYIDQALISVQALGFDLVQLTCQKRFDCRNAILWSSAILLGTSYS